MLALIPKKASPHNLAHKSLAGESVYDGVI
jgi:hypothetical protein